MDDHEIEKNPFPEEKERMSFRYHTAFESIKWAQEIPFLEFPTQVQFKVLPPFAGAIVRFHLQHKLTKRWLSVYLDAYELLGCSVERNQPYWEIYPNLDGDISRYTMTDVYSLMTEINSIFDAKNFHDLTEKPHS